VIGLLDLVVIFLADQKIADRRGVVDGLAADGLLMLGDRRGLLRDGNVLRCIFLCLRRRAALLRGDA